MKLIPQWRKSWRMSSVRLAAVLGILSAVQLELLPLIKPLVKPEAWPLITLVMAFLIIVFRNLAQPALHQDAQPEAKAPEAPQ